MPLPRPRPARWLPVLLLFAAHAATAATFTVTRGDDPPPDGCLAGDCSLREALQAAGATPEGDTVVLGMGQHFFSLGELRVVGQVALSGAGMQQTEVIGPGGIGVLRVTAYSRLDASRPTLVSGGSTALLVDDLGQATLHEVRVPAGGGAVYAGGGAPGIGTATVRVEHSRIEGAVACFLSSSRCLLSDSIVGTAAVAGADAALRLDRVEVGDSLFGVLASEGAELAINDSTIRNTLVPLGLNDDSAAPAPDVWIRRTRFIGNRGPIEGNRIATIHLVDVEFRDNVVGADNLDKPAVLLAGPGPTWRIDRALVVGNRGGGIGAAVQVEPGGALGIFNSTIDDNTFHPDATIMANASHAIAIFGNGIEASYLLMAQNTMRRAPGLAPDAPGSLLYVRWDTANVILANNLVQGTCAFGAGGSAGSGAGNIESPAGTCAFDPAQNQSLAEESLQVGALADHGGFTRSYEPAPDSPLVGAANEFFCDAFGGERDQRAFRRGPDGIGCDVGSVEVGAVDDTIFGDGFGP